MLVNVRSQRIPSGTNFQNEEKHLRSVLEDSHHKEQCKDYQHQYYLEHYHHINQRCHQYYQLKKDTIRTKKSIYYQRNKEAIRGKNRQYIIQNKEHITERKRYYRITNREDIKEKWKKYYLQNKHNLNLQLKQYRLENKHSISQQRRNYYLQHHLSIKYKKRLYYLQNKQAILERYRQSRIHCKKKNHIEWANPKSLPSFMLHVCGQLRVGEPMEWYRISRTQMMEVGGGSFFKQFRSLGRALECVYPEMLWDLLKFNLRGKKSTQRWLRVLLQQILPEKTLIKEDYLHPQLLWDEDYKHKMELDIWVPRYNLALEYQGEHHFNDLYRNGSFILYKQRDFKKSKMCLEAGIRLTTIPYWWDKKIESLQSFLFQSHPEVFPPSPGPFTLNTP